MKTKSRLTNFKKVQRRQFLKGSALATGGVLLSPFAANAFHVTADETLKVAVIGCGGRGTGAANQALKTKGPVKLVAMADAFRDRLDDSYKTLSKIYGNTGRLDVPEDHKFVGFDAYKNAIDLADVIILATPPGFRPYHFEYAVENGKHVFMEKPVATDPYGVRKVLEAGKKAKEKNLNVVVGLQRHYQQNYRDVLKRLKQDEVGQILSGQVYWNSDGVWVRERQPDQNEMEYQMRNWYYFVWLCGDHILEQHIHNIDVANWFIGEYPESAQGMGGREVRTGRDHGEIFDHHFVEFVYPSGAVIASQCRHIPGTLSRVQEQFQGTKGRIYTDGSGKANMYDLKGKVLYDNPGKGVPNPYQVEHDELFASIRAGEVIDDVEMGAKSTMAAILGRMATYSGQLLKWDEALASNMRIVPDEQDLTWESSPPIVPEEDGTYPIPIPGKTKVL